LVCLIAWVVTGREGNFLSLFKIDSKYMLLGGAIGAFITYTVIQSMNTLGPARSVMFIVTAQLLTAYIIELFGFFQVEKAHFEIRKVMGLVIIIIGIITFKWK
jgi:transporter family-2 protein